MAQGHRSCISELVVNLETSVLCCFDISKYLWNCIASLYIQFSVETFIFTSIDKSDIVPIGKISDDLMLARENSASDLFNLRIVYKAARSFIF